MMDAIYMFMNFIYEIFELLFSIDLGPFTFGAMLFGTVLIAISVGAIYQIFVTLGVYQYIENKSVDREVKRMEVRDRGRNVYRSK